MQKKINTNFIQKKVIELHTKFLGVVQQTYKMYDDVIKYTLIKNGNALFFFSLLFGNYFAVLLLLTFYHRVLGSALKMTCFLGRFIFFSQTREIILFKEMY